MRERLDPPLALLERLGVILHDARHLQESNQVSLSEPVVSFQTDASDIEVWRATVVDTYHREVHLIETREDDAAGRVDHVVLSPDNGGIAMLRRALAMLEEKADS